LTVLFEADRMRRIHLALHKPPILPSSGTRLSYVSKIGESFSPLDEFRHKSHFSNHL
jgi:hypothetical protein